MTNKILVSLFLLLSALHGQTVIQGPQGPRGFTGARGPAATIKLGTITTGEPGSSVTVTNSGSTQEAIFNFSIPRGSMLLSGTGAPTTQGANGDYFLSTDQACLYGPKAGGGWSGSCMSLYGTTWKGTWTSGTNYLRNDAVYYSGSSYRATANVSGSTSPDADTANWTPLALSGTAGLPPGISANGRNGLTMTGSPSTDTDVDTVGARNAAATTIANNVVATQCPPGLAQTPPIGSNSFNQLYSDSFDRANGAVVGSGSWTAVGAAASPNVSSNGVVASGGNQRAAWSQHPSPDQWESVKLTTVTGVCLGDCTHGLHLRESSDGNTYYYFTQFYSNSPQYGWVKNGTGHMCGFLSGFNSGDEIKMSVTGSSVTTLTVYINGSVAGSCTDSTSPILSGNYGLIVSPSGVMDDWKAGTVVSTSYSVCTPTGAAPIAPGVTTDGGNGLNVKGAVSASTLAAGGTVISPLCSAVDDTAYLNGLLSNSAIATIDFAGKQCVASNLVLQLDGLEIKGKGSITQKAGASGALFSDGGHRFSWENVELAGGDDTSKNGLSWESSPANSRQGMSIHTQLNSRISNTSIHGFGSWGITTADTGRDRTSHLKIDKVSIYNNYGGIQAGPNYAEYVALSNVDTHDNYIGILNSSGNVFETNPNHHDNAINYYLLGTGIPNNSHGSVVGGNFNHAALYALYCENTTNGQSFVGVDMFYGSLWLNGCQGISVTGGTMDLIAYYFQGGGRNYIVGNFSPATLANTEFHGWQGLPDSTVLNNYLANGTAQGGYRINPNSLAPLGTTVVIDGNFTSSANWSLSGATSISSNTIHFTGSGVAYQQPVLVEGTTYKICYTISNYTGGAFGLGSGVVSGSITGGNGTYCEFIPIPPTVTETSKRLILQGVGFTGDITNVSAQPLLPVAEAGANSSITSLSGLTSGTQTTPTPTCSSGTPTAISATLQTTPVGKSRIVTVAVVDTTNGTCAGSIKVPLGFTEVANASLSCTDLGTGVGGTGQLISGILWINKFDGTTFAASGHTIVCSGVGVSL